MVSARPLWYKQRSERPLRTPPRTRGPWLRRALRRAAVRGRRPRQGDHLPGGRCARARTASSASSRRGRSATSAIRCGPSSSSTVSWTSACWPGSRRPASTANGSASPPSAACPRRSPRSGPPAGCTRTGRSILSGWAAAATRCSRATPRVTSATRPTSAARPAPARRSKACAPGSAARWKRPWSWRRPARTASPSPAGAPCSPRASSPTSPTRASLTGASSAGSSRALPATCTVSTTRARSTVPWCSSDTGLSSGP